MTGVVINRPASMLRLFLLLIVLAFPAALLAKPPAGTCFAVATRSGMPAIPTGVTCAGEPQGYSDRLLWVRLPLPAEMARNGGNVVVHMTRFQSLKAVFVHADGSIETQAVGQGAYGSHWHIGGQIAFSSRRDKPLAAAWLVADGLENYGLLRIRFVAADALDRQFEFCALAIGAALALLAVVALYNLGLAVYLRRRFFLWHGCWAAAVLLWGIVWSQAELILFPELAGTYASRLATILACFAVMFAAICTADELRDAMALRANRSIKALGVATALIGLCASLPGADLTLYGDLLGIATLLTLVAVMIAIVWAWRREHVEGRHLFIAWIVPMLVLGATQFIDFNTALWGGGAQIAVLFASAFQTICLSALATSRLNALRIERDAALAAGARFAELADRDALTGLLNRRGFIARCEQTFGDLRESPFGLLLIDVDRFKRVNDRFGHEAGDAVLITLADALRSIEQQYLCLTGRLGGEEFVIGVSGMPSYSLRQLALVVRDMLGACDHGEVSRHQPVTVSIGVAEGAADGPFRALYGRADRALYDAKQLGRNMVVFASEAGEVSDLQFPLPLKPEE